MTGAHSATDDRRRSNRLTCHRCDEPIEEWCETRRYGFWDDDTQTYDSHGGVEEYYCRECWSDDFGRANGAHFRPTSAQQLFDILDTADGDLVAILAWWSGRPAIRVVDGEPVAAVTKPHRDGFNADGEPVITFEAEYIDDFDREEFDDIADPPVEQAMNIARLLAPEQTIFESLEDEI